jgi:hypothetical protein
MIYDSTPPTPYNSTDGKQFVMAQAKGGEIYNALALLGNECNSLMHDGFFPIGSPSVIKTSTGDYIAYQSMVKE